MNDKGRTIVLLIITVLVSIGAVRFVLTFKQEPEEKEAIAGKKLIQLQTVELKDHAAQISLTGQVSAIQKLELFSEVNGVLLNANFKEGIRFKKGEVLLQLDNSEIVNSIKAQKSILISQTAALMADIKTDFPDEEQQWELFLDQLNVEEKLPVLPKMNNEKFKRFLAGKNILNSYYNLVSLEVKLDKFTIVAPFDGVVTSSFLNKGTLVRVGQKLGEFIEPKALEYNTEVSLSDLKFIKLGDAVQLYSQDLGQQWTGKVYRINEKLETNTQRVKVFIKTGGVNLKEGMFLSAKLSSELFKNTYEVLRMNITDNTVFVYQKGKAIAKTIEVKYVNDDTAIVHGLKSGDSLIVGNLKGIYNNAAVVAE